ncbi:MAG: hypothetical protein COT24_02455, partial [Candidatus Kerfeldbacteria bacterium CG08_land_8_20_14_0_20_40_16]
GSCGGSTCTGGEICCFSSYCASSCTGGFTPEFIIRSFATACDNPLNPHEDVFLCSSIAINFNNVINIDTVKTALNVADIGEQTSGNNLIIEKCDDGASCTTTSKPAPLLDPTYWSGPTPQGITSEWVAANKSIVFYHIPYLFEEFTFYRVTITEDITDTSGRDITKCEKEGGTPIPGCTYNSGDGTWSWIFQTNDQIDDIPPEIVQAYPEFDTSETPPQYPNRNVSMAPTIWANFSEMIDPITVTEANITVTPIDPTGLDPITGLGGTLLTPLDPDQYNVFINPSGNGFQWQVEAPNWLDAYTWYEINVDNIYDLCSNEMTPAPTTWRFQTNGTFPGVNFVYPPNGYLFSCPDTEIFAQFNTSMYDITTSSCGVAPSGGGYVTGWTLSNNPGRVLGVEDDYPGSPADPNRYCKKYSWMPTSSSLPLDTDFAAHIDTRIVIDSELNTLEVDWGFHVTEPSSCANPPYITRLDPAEGPENQCFTVFGNYFGTGTDPQDRVELGDVQTPVNAGAWTEHVISTRVPAGLIPGTSYNTKAFVYHPPPIDQVLESNEVSFQIDLGTFAGPCIDYITPEEGYEGTGVTIVGSEFDPTSAFKDVWFTDGTYSAGYNTWGDTQITTNVPTGAGNGDVTVENDQGVSNGWPFTVLHVPPGTPTVVQNSSCDFGVSPPIYASPTPWLNQNNVCFDTVISARFNINPGLNSMDPATFNDSNIFLDKCTDESCTTTDRVTPVTITSQGYEDPDDMFKLTPGSPLDQNTWYQATIMTGVQSADHVPLAANYIWKFRTKDEPGNCPLSGVGVLPTSATINWGGTQGYNSDPIGPGCQLLNPSSYEWSWNSTNTNRAYIVGSPSGSSATARSSDNQEGNSWIQAITTGVAGQSLLRVDFSGCEVDPTICTDPLRGGCVGSECVDGLCTPIMSGVDPASGPIGQYVTVSGCWFGAYDPAVSKVEFTGIDLSFVEAKWPKACGPAGSTWSSNSIVVEVPDDETADLSDDAQDGPMKVTVQTSLGPRSDESNNGIGPPDFTFDVSGGVAVNLCPFNPAWGYNGDSFTAIGEGFGSYDPASDNISFFKDPGRINASITDWTDTQINGTVPPQALSSIPPNGVYVTADGNNSNQVPYTVRCDTNSQCITDCCYGYQCRDAAYCSTGAPGDLCQIPSNDNCLNGPISFPSGYDCMSTTGDIESTSPPPPEPPPFGDDCRVCCEPGQTYNALICTENQGDCTGAERGLYCGCTRDDECGNPDNIGCGATDPRCCYTRPNVASTDPADGEREVCLNSAITVTFDRLMDPDSLTNFSLQVGAFAVAGDISSYNESGHTVLVFTPHSNLTAGTNHTGKVAGDPNLSDGNPEGVLSSNLTGMNGPHADNSYQFRFRTGEELCEIDHISTLVIPPGDWINNDLFICVGDACTDDQNPGSPLNQHIYAALALDANNTLLAADYTWSDPEAGGVIDVESPDEQWGYVTALGPDGQENIQVTADAGEAGQASTFVVTTVDACQSPWPANSPYKYPGAAIPTPPGEPTNFETRYCRDGGLPGITTPIIFNNPSYTYGDGTDEMIREIFFNPDDGSGDVIGIRVMENEGFLSSQAWFDNMFPEDAGAGGSALIVDGYQALKVGRTTYVAATNLVGGDLYPNIYLISYNDNAQSSTVNIYNQMIENWFFNAHPIVMFSACSSSPTETNKQCIIRDTERVTELGEIAFSLLQYKNDNGRFPLLSAGTYLEGTTTSKWNSWISALGNEIGITPSVDPLNAFDPASRCPVPPYDSAGTCWNDNHKVYTCPENSHIYQYSTFNSGNNAFLYANLEYNGTGNWRTDPPMGSDPCAAIPGSTSCECFNYQIEGNDSFIPSSAPASS